MRAKPVAGFPSLKAAVASLLGEGYGREDIEIKLKLTREQLRNVLSDLRSEGVSTPPSGRKPGPKLGSVREVRPIGTAAAAATEGGFELFKRAGAERAGMMAKARHEARFRLRSPNGERFLHMSGEGTTGARDWAWIGFSHQLKALLKQKPVLRRYRVEPVAPEGKGKDVLFNSNRAMFG